MAKKVFLWSICISVYVMFLPVAVSSFLLFCGAELSEDGVQAVLFCYGLSLFAFIFLVSLNSLVADSRGAYDCPDPYGVTAAVKLALVPYYVLFLVAFFLLVICGFPDAAYDDDASLAVCWLLNTIAFLCVPAATSLQAAAYLVRRMKREEKLFYLLWLLPLFVHFADVSAAVLLQSGCGFRVHPPAPSFVGAAGSGAKGKMY